jgi:outer membrane protein assembly factor BamD
LLTFAVLKMPVISLKTPSVQILISAIVLFAAAAFLPSCDNYSKIARKASVEQKYQMAMNAFEKGEYYRALPLLEELITVYRGTANAEKVQYYYAYCNYNTSDYILAAYHFKSFVKSFPTSTKAEECAYMNAYCYYLTSPVYSLDQTDTHVAIRELQSFVNQYPKSKHLEEANTIIAKLRVKLETKASEIAKQYFKISNYKSAIVAVDNFAKDFPDSKMIEELRFVQFKSHYFLTLNSIDTKRAERLRSTVDTYLKFVDRYPSSPFLKEAAGFYELTLKLKDKYKIQLNT